MDASDSSMPSPPLEVLRKAVTPVCPMEFCGTVLDVVVLDDSTRAITDRGVLRALASKNTDFGRFYDRIANECSQLRLPPRLSFKTLEGPVVMGLAASALADLCGALTDLALAGRLDPKQRPLAARARVIEKALTKVAIIALIDEATGYQYARGDTATARILRLCLLDLPLPWERIVPEEFYVLVCRLYGYAYRPGQRKKPRFLRSFTWNYLYECLPPEVREELQRVNHDPHTTGTKHHQLLTPEARAVFREQLVRVMTLVRQSADEADFRRRYAHEFHGAALQLWLPPPR